jgi:rhodanese-related sulfurtransferase
MVEEVTPRQFMERRDGGEALTLLDVREAWEVKLAPAPTEHLHIPMGELAARLGELDPQAPVVVICRSGGRSMQVAHFLEGRQFRAVANLSGGILEWSRDLDPRIPRY